MKKLGLVVGAVAAAAGCALAPSAHAYPFSGPKGDYDDQAYWVDLAPYNQGSHIVTVTEAGKMGRFICSKLESGDSEGDIIASVNSNDTSSIGADQFIVDAAEWHYCPTYY